MKQRRYYATHSEVLALEQAARRAQAVELWRLLTLAGRELKLLAVRGATGRSETPGEPSAPVHRRQLNEPRKHDMRRSIIEELADSLPVEMRARYAGDIAAAARVEPLIDFGLAAWDFTVRVLAHAFEGAARGLRAAARSLDFVARRLAPAH